MRSLEAEMIAWPAVRRLSRSRGRLPKRREFALRRHARGPRPRRASANRLPGDLLAAQTQAQDAGDRRWDETALRPSHPQARRNSSELFSTTARNRSTPRK
jgi:hypothetical protein